ncbi:MAG: GTP cyclohydrolase I, partial [Thermoanaerobaculia bacterium]
MEKKLEKLFYDFLKIIGEDLKRQGLKNTPKRVAKSWIYLLKGYREDPEKLIKSAIFRETSEDMICVRNIEFYSLCEHHLIPFFGKCHIGYIPKGYIIGLSKLCRLVEIYARRLQVQERMT